MVEGRHTPQGGNAVACRLRFRPHISFATVTFFVLGFMPTVRCAAQPTHQQERDKQLEAFVADAVENPLLPPEFERVLPHLRTYCRRRALTTGETVPATRDALWVLVRYEFENWALTSAGDDGLIRDAAAARLRGGAQAFLDYCLRDPAVAEEKWATRVLQARSYLKAAAGPGADGQPGETRVQDSHAAQVVVAEELYRLLSPTSTHEINRGLQNRFRDNFQTALSAMQTAIFARMQAARSLRDIYGSPLDATRAVVEPQLPGDEIKNLYPPAEALPDIEIVKRLQKAVGDKVPLTLTDRVGRVRALIEDLTPAHRRLSVTVQARPDEGAVLWLYKDTRARLGAKPSDGRVPSPLIEMRLREVFQAPERVGVLRELAQTLLTALGDPPTPAVWDNPTGPAAELLGPFVRPRREALTLKNVWTGELIPAKFRDPAPTKVFLDAAVFAELRRRSLDGSELPQALRDLNVVLPGAFRAWDAAEKARQLKDDSTRPYRGRDRLLLQRAKSYWRPEDEARSMAEIRLFEEVRYWCIQVRYRYGQSAPEDSVPDWVDLLKGVIRRNRAGD
jgi:hypothetical protein